MGQLGWELQRTLERLGIADNALVIVSSDNGPEVTSVVNMRREYQHDGARPWRGMKRDQWEGGHRIPFIDHLTNAIDALGAHLRDMDQSVYPHANVNKGAKKLGPGNGAFQAHLALQVMDAGWLLLCGLVVQLFQ